METVDLRVKKLTETAEAPYYHHCGDACLDLCADEDYDLKPNERKAISTGIAIQIPENYEGQVRPRSGMASKFGISVLNTPGTIDSNYRGEVKVILINLSDEIFSVKKRMKISQLKISPVPQVNVIVVNKLDENLERGDKGFNSSGLFKN